MSENSDIFDHPDLRDTDWSAKLRREVRRSRWRRNRTRLLVIVVVAVVTGFVVYVALRPKENKPDQSAPVVQPVPTTPVSTTPTTSVPPTNKVDLTRPFLSTPAAGWSDGVDGMVVPQATAVNGFSADKVTKALNLTRDALSASYLDRRVIQDGNVEVLAGLFAPDGRADIRDQPTRHVRIKSGYRLLDASPKVKGELTVSAGEKGEIVIRANFAVAYAFYTDHPDRLQSAMDIVAVLRFDNQYVYRESGQFAKSSWGLWAGAGENFWYSISCSALKDGLLAPAYSERLNDVVVPIASSVAFEPSAPMPTTGNCPS